MNCFLGMKLRPIAFPSKMAVRYVHPRKPFRPPLDLEKPAEPFKPYQPPDFMAAYEKDQTAFIIKAAGVFLLMAWFYIYDEVVFKWVDGIRGVTEANRSPYSIVEQQRMLVPQLRHDERGPQYMINPEFRELYKKYTEKRKGFMEEKEQWGGELNQE